MSPRNRIRQRSASLLLVLIAIAGGARAESTDATRITWSRCSVDSELLKQVRPDIRLECGSLAVPVDYRHDDGRSTEVQVLRIHTGSSTDRRRTLFFNFGGPGLDPRSSLHATTYNWATMPQDDTLGGFATLIDHFDFVTMAPRGTDMTYPLLCGQSLLPSIMDILRDRNDEQAWKIFIDGTKAFAEQCATAAAAIHVDTDTHVHDIERFRIGLGATRLSFYGASYGSWIALWYASLFPSQVDRMLLDGAVNFGSTWSDQFRHDIPVRDEAMIDAALQPIADRPQYYGLGDSVSRVLVGLMKVPLPVRMLWYPELARPETMAAAITVGRWIRENRSVAEIDALVANHTFSHSPAYDRLLNDEAKRLLGMAFPGSPSAQGKANVTNLTRLSVNFATYCNDTPWERDTADWRRFIEDKLAFSMSLRPSEPTLAMVCAQWPGSPASKPDPSALVGVHALFLHGEYDISAPWLAAQRSLEMMPNSRAILVRDTSEHVLFGRTMLPCMERRAVQYLLTGVLPPERITHCDAHASTTL
ncbi:MAG: Tripeptidyl aminopeptidase [Luteibacter sp.]|uniref:alpha/beta fold hydrolase n=1 Tax=Luteibacter sp. TaxID=1886636 RepID=UPI0013832F61|nr:alpha/beta hydrolase [Luteibacter sp.]KAF1006332.1 MAG: Tripeptidyl aminopeptidase [Luteibacter sp.]